MSKMSNSGLRRVIGASAVAAVAAVGLASMGAGNAAAGPLPGGTKTTVGIDGTAVTISRTAESAYPVASVANNGAGRSAEVSANVFARVKGNATGILTTGYIVGCQIDITGLTGGLSGSLNIVGGGTVAGSISVPLKPGQAVKTPIRVKNIKSGVSAIQYKRYEIAVQQCGGYASARAYTEVQLTGDYYIKSTLYGNVFSIG
ncbi:MspA family porin [Williamsia sp. M5A3_1d]